MITIASRLQPACFIAGVALLLGAALLLLAQVMGLVSIESLLPGGESAPPSVARVAVVGCVLAAIGSWDLPNGKPRT